MKLPNLFKFSKYSLGLIVLIILTIGSVAVGTMGRNSDQLSELLAERSLSFLEVFERIVYNSAREGRAFEINDLAKELIEVRGFLFFAITDEKGKVLLHTDENQIGKDLVFINKRRHDNGVISLPDGSEVVWEEVKVYGKDTLITYIEIPLPKYIENRREELRKEAQRRENRRHSHSENNNRDNDNRDKDNRGRDNRDDGGRDNSRFFNGDNKYNPYDRNTLPENLSEDAKLFFESMKNVETLFAFVGQDMFLHHRAQERSKLVVLTGAIAIFIVILTGIALQQYVSRHEEEQRRNQVKLNAISDLTAGVAHEIRNPLSSIKGYATFFKHKFEKGSNEEVAASIMVEEVDRLNRAIDDLVGLNRSFDIELEEVDIVQVLYKLCHLIEPEIKEKNIDLKLLVDSDVKIYVYADADKIKQALLNLILNSIESFEKDDLEKKIYIEALKKNKHALVSIIDNGVGIKKEIIDRIYDPYFTTKTQGTGLGLVMVKNIIGAHKGELDISSPSSIADYNKVAREGTEVNISLPLARKG